MKNGVLCEYTEGQEALKLQLTTDVPPGHQASQPPAVMMQSLLPPSACAAPAGASSGSGRQLGQNAAFVSCGTGVPVMFSGERQCRVRTTKGWDTVMYGCVGGLAAKGRVGTKNLVQGFLSVMGLPSSAAHVDRDEAMQKWRSSTSGLEQSLLSDTTLIHQRQLTRKQLAVNRQ